MRWFGLSAAAMAILVGFQYPSRSPAILKPAIQVVALLTGICVIIIPGLIEPSARTLCLAIATLWSILSAAIFIASRTRPMIHWQKIVVYSPFASSIVLLFVFGEIHDGVLFLIPAFMVATGFLICRNTTWVNTAIFSAGLVVGLPAGLMAFTGVPNEIAELCGMSPAESRVVLLGTSVLLMWAISQSFLNKRMTSFSMIRSGNNAAHTQIGEGTEK